MYVQSTMLLFFDWKQLLPSPYLNIVKSHVGCLYRLLGPFIILVVYSISYQITM